jgi:hypothetical protein
MHHCQLISITNQFSKRVVQQAAVRRTITQVSVPAVDGVSRPEKGRKVQFKPSKSPTSATPALLNAMNSSSEQDGAKHSIEFNVLNVYV